MFFTQEDYRKIEKWLLANSRKDTDFAGAATPLKGNETVVLVQNGKNVKASVKDVVEQLFLLGVSDFVNITDKYGESYISLSQAIELIPYRSRKIGQVVTFLDDTGKWAMFQFQGTRENQWGTLSLWVDLIDLMTGVTIIDSEDIVTETNSANQVSLKFADKVYNTADYSGLGRIYLRKNITKVEDPVTGNTITMNLLQQSMVSKENTIYIVQYSYDLNKQTISIPEGSILVFEGGDINNGTINCNGTIIVGKFSGNVTIAGTYSFQDAQADEEDITQNQSSVLKFKDKEYDEANFSGLGRTYLRKNIVNGVNVLTQDMINNPNTIYHIQYDYNLNGQTITIPSGCVLLFEGGSISNGVIVGNNTTINNNVRLGPNIITQGTFNIDSIKLDNIIGEDFETAFGVALSLTSTIELGNKTYISKSPIKIEKSVNIIGNNATIHFAPLYSDSNADTIIMGQPNIFDIRNAPSIKISDITLEGEYDGTTFAGAHKGWAPADTNYNLINIYQCSKVHIEGITITNYFSNNYIGDGSYDRWFIDTNGLNPIMVSYADKVDIINCREVKSSGESWVVAFNKNVYIDNFSVDNKYGTSYLDILYCDKAIIDNCTFIRSSQFYNGDLVNINSSNTLMSNSYFYGGHCDISNEYKNTGIDVNYIIENITIDNCIFNHFSAFVCNASANTDSSFVARRNVTIKNCTQNIDNNMIAAVGFTGAAGFGFLTGSKDNDEFFTVQNNTINIINPYQLVDYTRLQIFAFAQTKSIKNFDISNNTVSSDFSTTADILTYIKYTDVNYFLQINGKADTINISNNTVNVEWCPIGFSNTTDVKNITIIDNNFRSNSFITLYKNNVIDGITIAGNTFDIVSLNTTYAIINSNFRTSCFESFIGFGFVATNSTTINNCSIKDNTVKCLSFITSQRNQAVFKLTNFNIDNNIHKFKSVSTNYIDTVMYSFGIESDIAGSGHILQISNNTFIGPNIDCGIQWNIRDIETLIIDNNTWDGYDYTIIRWSIGGLSPVSRVGCSYIGGNNRFFDTFDIAYGINDLDATNFRNTDGTLIRKVVII